MDKSFGAVVVAAGNSSRMGGGRSKTLADLAGKPVVRWSLESLAACPEIAEIVIVCRAEDTAEMQLAAAGLPLQVTTVVGGSERQESVRRGVEALALGSEYILIHDGARPMVTPKVISRVCADAIEYGAATAAVPAKDTCKLGDGFVEETPPREKLFAVQTPQAFKKDMYLYAIGRAEDSGKSYTDDCQLIESVEGRVRLTDGDYRNIKITTPEDLLTVRAFISDSTREEKTMRIGSGYDVHKLTEGRDLILGGVKVPFEKGLLGHSDADVLTHAIADALLGAAALGDIGKLFPDTDPKFKGADSLVLLREVCHVLDENGYSIVNIDSTLVAQRPKISPYIVTMRHNIAAACGIDPDCVSVKATTEEGLGFTGTGEGMSATAVCLIESKS